LETGTGKDLKDLSHCVIVCAGAASTAMVTSQAGVQDTQ
jgi:hypothetical protein